MTKKKTCKLKGFISVPKPSELALSPTEKRRLEELAEWQEASSKTTIMLGVPLNQQPR